MASLDEAKVEEELHERDAKRSSNNPPGFTNEETEFLREYEAARGKAVVRKVWV